MAVPTVTGIMNPMRLTRLAVAATCLLALTGCGSDDSAATDAADEVATTGSSPSASVDPSAVPGSDTPTSGASWPGFGPPDYRYQLRVLCYCPQLGPIEIVVKDDEVVRATRARGAARGTSVPEFASLTINEIIAMANDPAVAKATVTWPDGQDHPSAVELDRIAAAIDDEVTYAISKVRVGAG